QGHQFHQVMVGTDKVADDVDLPGNDVDGRQVDVAAVADDVVRAATPQQLWCQSFSPGLADEVEDDVRPAGGDVLDGRQHIVVRGCLHRVLSANRSGQLQGRLGSVDDRNSGRGDCGEGLNRDVAQTARPDDHGVGAGEEIGGCLSDCVVGSQ